MLHRDYSEKALEITDQIMDLTCDLRKILLMHERELRALLARRGLALIDGGGDGVSATAESAEGIAESVVVHVGGDD